MEKTRIIETILSPLERIALKSGIEYIECISLDRGDKTLYKRSYSSDFPYMAYDVLVNNEIFRSCDLTAVSHIELTSKYEVKVFCHIYPAIGETGTHDLLIIETKGPLDENTENTAEYISSLISAFAVISGSDSAAQDNSEKYKKELLNIRDIQSRLFPRFDDIKDLDIKSAYLPSELMSGTFIDGILLDSSTYQLTACDVSGSFPASSFIGAAIRTIIRSDAPQKKIPSAMIESVINKIKTMIAGAAGNNIFLTIYQFNLKTNKIVVSSWGVITSLFYIKKKNGVIDLATTETGKLFSNRNFIRDMTITLEQGDAILYYSRGVSKSKNENTGTEYGIEKLKNEFKDNIETGSLDAVHSVIESVYEFTEYSQLSDDIILIAIKKI